MENENPLNQPDAAQPASDAPGAGKAAEGAGLSEIIQRASDAAVAQHLAEANAPKRGRGRPIIHGKYSTKLPVENVGVGAAAAPGQENAPVVYPLGWAPAPPVFDEKAAEAMVDVAISGLNYLGSFLVRVIGQREIPDPAVVDRAVANCQVNEDARKHLRQGGVACLRKYAVNLDYGPEFMLGMGLLMWGSAVGGQVKTLKEQAERLRKAQ